MARGAIEERSDHLGGVEALGMERLVDEQLHHLQLIQGQTRDAVKQRLGPLVELIRGRRLHG
jgi:hypothetical protein